MDTSTEDLKTPPDEVDEDEKDTKIAAEVETHPPQSQEDEETTLFVCADVASHDSRAQSAKVGTNDRETIERLRKAYRNISSKWPGVKRITGIRFFRVSSMADSSSHQSHLTTSSSTAFYSDKQAKTNICLCTSTKTSSAIPSSRIQSIPNIAMRLDPGQ